MYATSELRHQPAVGSTCFAEARTAPAPVRVCFLIDELARAGTETQLLALIRHLDRSRVAPYLCLLRGESASSRELEPLDCPVMRLGVGALARPGTVRAALGFTSFLRRERIDVLQVYFPDSCYFGIPLGCVAGVPGRVRTRNNLGHWLTPFHRCLGRLLNGLTTHTITNCQAARTALLDHERPQPESVIVLENGVNLERFSRIPAVSIKGPQDTKTVGMVANLRPVKGVDLLIRAAQRLVESDSRLHFQVAGDGEHRAALAHLIQEQGLVGKFELRGAVADIPSFLGEIDVAVLCSHAEGMPNAVLEYMAAGRPIVATDVGAVSDLIDNGVHGLIVPAGDVVALADAIARLLRDPQLAQTLGAAARRRVQEHYSRDAMVGRFERFYQGFARQTAAELGEEV